MVKVTIDNKIVEVDANTRLIEACKAASVEIPHFCYHQKLEIAGNCRMCLVEVDGTPKPVASCATLVRDGMIIKTKSSMAENARKSVMSLLLANHPLDCPICDQGGECDLQDQALFYGKDRSRYREDKRSVEDKDVGPLINTVMTRCIHCTRCIRFANDVAGVEEIGAIGRGENTEIVTYLNRAIKSELSGNLVDLCPVGALTSKPYKFKARSWELNHVQSIDISDAVGCNIRVDSKNGQVVRVLPENNEHINEEWISDKTRYMIDGLNNQRIDRPYIRKHGKLVAASWSDALSVIKKEISGLRGEQIATIAGDLADAESMMVLVDIMKHYQSRNLDHLQEKTGLDISNRTNYLFNTTIAGIEDSDLCLLIGCNPRHEATLVNCRIRKRWKVGDYQVFVMGNDNLDLTYPYQNLGDDPHILSAIANGKHEICTKMKQAKKPMMIIGYGVLERQDSKAILSLCSRVAEKFNFVNDEWNGFNILHRDAAAVAALDLGFIPGKQGLGIKSLFDETKNQDIKFVYLLNADDVPVETISNEKFIVYQGHHGDRSANYADVVLPGRSYVEKEASYVNLEGRVQMTKIAAKAPGEAKEDSKILLDLAKKLSIPLNYHNINELRNELYQRNNYILNQCRKGKWKGIDYGKEKLLEAPITPLKINYYFSNVICRASKTMIDCVKEFGGDND